MPPTFADTMNPQNTLTWDQVMGTQQPASTMSLSPIYDQSNSYATMSLFPISDKSDSYYAGQSYNPMQQILSNFQRMLGRPAMNGPRLNRPNPFIGGGDSRFAPPPGGAPTGTQYGRDGQLTMRDMFNPNVHLSSTDRQYLGGLPFYNNPNSARAYDFANKMGTPGMDQWQRPEGNARQMPRPGTPRRGPTEPGDLNNPISMQPQGPQTFGNRQLGRNEPLRKAPNRPTNRSQQRGENG